MKVAFLWHMHQPSYWDAKLGRYRYPWAFLHGARHYFAMAHRASLHPAVRMTFNLTPVLMEQLDHYAAGGALDPLLETVVRPAEDLGEEDRRRLVDHVFQLNPATMIDPFPRYRELRGLLAGGIGAAKLRRVHSRDLLDLQTLYLLTWCGAPIRREEPVRALLAKGKGFTEEEKQSVFAAMGEAVRGTIPLYRKLQDAGQIEVATTPYFHPILPLLIDSESARESRPDVDLEGIDFRYGQDAEWHIAAAIDAYRGRFGRAPDGMWPAEGSLSEGALDLLAARGVRWTATDERVLARSLGRPAAGADKFRVFRFRKKIRVHFRDQGLSDRIGFVYSSWDPSHAAGDLIANLKRIQDDLGARAGEACVSIILDGENPWEHYPDGGAGFLDLVYRLLAETPGLETVRFRDLEASNDVAELERVVPGSWIDANFDTWIGAKEKNHAWKMLAAARRKLAQEAPEAEVPVEFYRAEGSDWFWWLGPGHDTPYESSYENLFRLNLEAGLARAGLPAPEILHAAVPAHRRAVFERPTHRFTPKIDGRAGGYYAWIAAGSLRASEGSIHRADRRFERLRFGFDSAHLYLRLEGDFEPLHRDASVAVAVEFRRPRALRYTFDGEKLAIAAEKDTVKDTVKDDLQPSEGKGAFEAVVELQIPLSEISAAPGDVVELAASFSFGADVLDRLPSVGFLTTEVPSAEFGRENWSV